MPQIESQTVLLYDIPHDRTRVKVSQKCLDFGLERFQYSAFHGPLTRNRREELALAVEHLIEVHGGAIAIFPLCATDRQNWINVYVEPPPLEMPTLKLVIGATNADSEVCRAD